MIRFVFAAFFGAAAHDPSHSSSPIALRVVGPAGEISPLKPAANASAPAAITVAGPAQTGGLQQLAGAELRAAAAEVEADWVGDSLAIPRGDITRLPALVVERLSGFLRLQRQLAESSLRILQRPSLGQVKAELSSLVGEAPYMNQGSMSAEAELTIIIGVGGCTLVLLVIIILWVNLRTGTPMQPEPRSVGQLLGMTSFRFYAGFLMCTWVPFVVAEEGEALWNDHQVVFMGIGKAILATAMILTPIFGIMNDETIHRWGRRRVWFISGVIMISCGVFICAIASLKMLPIMYMVGVACWCIGEAIAESTTEALVPDLCLPEDYDAAAAIRGLLFMLGGIFGYVLIIISAEVLDWNQSMFYLFYIAVVLITAPPMIFYACPTEAEKMQYDMRENEETDASVQLRRGSVPGDSSVVEDFDVQEKERSYFQRGYLDTYNASPLFGIVSVVTAITSASSGSLLFVALTIRDVTELEDYRKRQLHFALLSMVMLLTASITSIILGCIQIGREHRFQVICWFIAINGILECALPFSHYAGPSWQPRLIALYVVGGLKGFAFGGMYNLMQPMAWDSIPEAWKSGVGAVSRAQSWMAVCRSVGIGFGNIAGSMILESTYYLQENKPPGPVKYPVHGYIALYAVSAAYCAISVGILIHVMSSIRSGDPKYVIPDSSSPSYLASGEAEPAARAEPS